jgi:hypothetical protein
LNQRTKYVVVTTLVVAAFSVLPAGALPGAAAAAPGVSILPSGSSDTDTAEEHERPLLELITSDLRGRLYTLNPAEAEKAVAEHGFKRTDESDGITMFNRKLEGTVPVHRLRLREGHHAYLLASNRNEISRLSDPDDADRQFDDEGVVGYVYQRPRPGDTMTLVRYSNNKGDWRVARANRADLLAAGFKVDGPLGHVPVG